MFEKFFTLPQLMKYYKSSKTLYDLFDFTLHDISPNKDKLTLKLSFPEKLQANEGIIHGGITCFVLDSIAGIFAMLSNKDSSQKALTKNISVSFLKPIAPKTIYTVTANRIFNDEIEVKILDHQGHEMIVGRVEIVFK